MIRPAGLIALWLLLVPAIAGAGVDALRRQLDRCLTQTDTTTNLQQTCSELAGRLRDPALDLPDAPTREQLQILRRLLTPPEAAAPAPPDYAALPDLLRDIYRPEARQQPSLWERLLDWLRDNEAEPPELDWLQDWLDSLTPSERVSEWFLYGSLLLVLALALAIVINELRAAGLLRRRPRHAGGQDALLAPASPRSGPASDLASVAALPPGQQPAALLALSVAHLTRRERLPDDRSRTPRELWRHLKRHHPSLAPGFGRLAGLTEQVVYGDRPPTADELAAGREQTRTLLQEGKG